jgi:hypothetical protein
MARERLCLFVLYSLDHFLQHRMAAAVIGWLTCSAWHGACAIVCFTWNGQIKAEIPCQVTQYVLVFD